MLLFSINSAYTLIWLFVAHQCYIPFFSNSGFLGEYHQMCVLINIQLLKGNFQPLVLNYFSIYY